MSIEGAYMCGVKLVSSQYGHMEIELATGDKQEYQLLEMIEFDSDRKRMSVIVENKTKSTHILTSRINSEFRAYSKYGVRLALA